MNLGKLPLRERWLRWSLFAVLNHSNVSEIFATLIQWGKTLSCWNELFFTHQFVRHENEITNAGQWKELFVDLANWKFSHLRVLYSNRWTEDAYQHRNRKLGRYTFSYCACWTTNQFGAFQSPTFSVVKLQLLTNSRSSPGTIGWLEIVGMVFDRDKLAG